MPVGGRGLVPAACAMAVGLAAVGGCGGVSGTGGSSPESTPALPVQRAGTVEEFTLTSMESPQPPDGLTVNLFDEGGHLRGPHFLLSVSWSAVGTELDDVGVLFEQAGLTPRRAPDGHELVVLAVDPRFRNGHYQPGGGDQPDAELVIGDQAKPLESLPLPPSDASSENDATVVVASVPARAPVRLRVTDEGRTQTLDARTGERGEDAIEGYYRPNYDELPTEQMDVKAGVSVLGGRDFVSTSLGVDFTNVMTDMRQPRAFATPYTPVQDWAPDGRAWLVVSPPRVFVEPEPDQPGLTLHMPDSQGFRIRLPDGTTIGEVGGQRKLETHNGSALEDYEELVFNVPADFAKGTFEVDLSAASVMAVYRDGELPGSWAPAPKPLRIPIELE